MRGYSALEHSKYCTVPGGYPEYPDQLRGGLFSTVVMTSTCHRKTAKICNKDRRNRPHAAEFLLGSVSSTVPENSSVVSQLPASVVRGYRGPHAQAWLANNRARRGESLPAGAVVLLGSIVVRLLPTKPCRTRVGDKEWHNGRRAPTQDPSTNDR